MFAETAFRVITPGFYGALRQAFRRLEPPWVAFAIILVLAPAAVQLLEFLVHLFYPHAEFENRSSYFHSDDGTGVAVQLVFDAPRAMLTGREGRPFSADLKRFPLVYGFLTAIPIAIAGCLRRDK